VSGGSEPKRSGLKRSGPIRRKAPIRRTGTRKKRRPKVTCEVRGCVRAPIRDFALCTTHAKAEADQLCRRIVRERDRTCRRCGEDGARKQLQWAHVLSRRALSIRWSLEPPNSFLLCSGCHFEFTNDVAAWLDWLDEHHPGLLDELRRLRREAIERGDHPDYPAVIADLRSRLSD